MATWQQFRDEAPELAAVADDRLPETGLVLVGTLRSDGWPRISPVGPLFAADIDSAVVPRFENDGRQTTSLWRPGAAPTTTQRQLQ
jgi:hypothetical protein